MIKKILVSQPKPASDKSPYFEIEKKYGVELTFHPLIKVECLSAKEFRQQRVQILDYSAIVFNSRHAIDHFFTLCKDMRIAIPEDMKYFGISETVALYIQKYVQYRKRKVFFGTTGKWPDLVAVMAKHKSERYLIPQSDVHGDEVHMMLDAKKIKHTECVMYRTVNNEMPDGLLDESDMVVVFTPAGVHSLLTNCPTVKDSQKLIGCFGKATVKAAQDEGLNVVIEAPTVETPSMPSALEQYLEQNKD